jgi:hypothetical protein
MMYRKKRLNVNAAGTAYVFQRYRRRVQLLVIAPLIRPHAGDASRIRLNGWSG